VHSGQVGLRHKITPWTASGYEVGQEPGQPTFAVVVVAGGADGLGGDEVGLADQGGVRGTGEDHPVRGVGPVLDSDQVAVGSAFAGRGAGGSRPAGRCSGGCPGSRRSSAGSRHCRHWLFRSQAIWVRPAPDSRWAKIHLMVSAGGVGVQAMHSAAPGRVGRGWGEAGRRPVGTHTVAVRRGSGPGHGPAPALPRWCGTGPGRPRGGNAPPVA